MTVTFSNPGELDIRAATTMGVHVKPGEASIGFFGTGLKYAIAVLLRKGCTIRIHSGRNRYRFKPHNESIRGKDFGLVYMSTNENAYAALGFTIDLGKTWGLEQAYRELWSNAKDEGGTTDEPARAPRPGSTQIIVDGPEFDKVHANRNSFILPEGLRKLWNSDITEVYSGQSQSVFYKGIAVLKLNRPSLYTYNIVCPLDLTEDRTARYTWEVNRLVKNAFISLAPELRTAALISDEYYEHDLDWAYSTPPTEFRRQVEELSLTHFKSISGNLIQEVLRVAETTRTEWKADTLTVAQTAMLDAAFDWLINAGYTVTAEVYYRKTLGATIHGCWYNGKIWLAEAAFISQEHLQAVLLEEHLHCITGKTDESREFQNSIIGELIKKINELNVLRGELPSCDPRLTKPFPADRPTPITIFTDEVPF